MKQIRKYIAAQKKRSCHNHLLSKPDDQATKAAYKTAYSTLQAKLRTMQNDWWTGIAERTQHYADMGGMRAFQEALNALTPDLSPSTLFGWKYPADRQRSHPPALVRAFRKPLQRPSQCAGVFTGQGCTSGCKVGV